jgi:hypothetical protein
MYTLKGGRICGRVVLLLSLLAISILPSIGVKTVYASEASANWHTTEGWPSTPPYNWSECWPDEVDVSEDVVYYIFQKFISLDYEWTMFSSQYTTAYNILSVANSMDTYDYAAVFLYAHGCNYTEYGYVDFGEEPIPIPVEHYRAFMGPLGDSSDDLYDWDLGYTNEDGGHHFVFMWECMSANIVGYWDYDDWIYDEEMGWGW